MRLSLYTALLMLVSAHALALPPVDSDKVVPKTEQPHIEVAPKEQYLVLDWEELIPEDERNIPLFTNDPAVMVPEGSLDDLLPPQEQGGVRNELAGSSVQIPGFVVPLEGDAKRVTAFLLVPYFGACIHMPAPPTNQVIYVEYPKGVPVSILWDAVQVSGPLEIHASSFDVGAAGYRIQADYVEPYIEE